MGPAASFAPVVRVQGEYCFVFLQTVKLKPEPIEPFIRLSRNANGDLPVVVLVGWYISNKGKTGRWECIYPVQSRRFRSEITVALLLAYVAKLASPDTVGNGLPIINRS